MEQLLKRHLLVLANLFSSTAGLSLSVIGGRAMNHSKFFGRLAKSDTSITLKTYDRLAEWFSENWPTECNWPTDIPRPSIQHQPASAPESDVIVTERPEGVDLASKEIPDRVLPASDVDVDAPITEPAESN